MENELFFVSILGIINLFDWEGETVTSTAGDHILLILSL